MIAKFGRDDVGGVFFAPLFFSRVVTELPAIVNGLSGFAMATESIQAGFCYLAVPVIFKAKYAPPNLFAVRH
jgi:hypothetical protein